MRWLVVLLFLACAAPKHAQTPAVRFPVPADVGRLVVDSAAFASFAASLRAGLAGSTDTEARFVLSMLDGLDGHWTDAVEKLDAIAASDPDPLSRAMRGLSIRVWADGGVFRDSLAAHVDALPPAAKPQLGELRAMAHAFTPDVCRTLVVENVKPQDGTVTLADAHTIVFQRYAVVRLVPVGADIEAVLAARGIDLPAADQTPQ